MLNKTDIAKDVGVLIKAIGDWISVLEASGQIILLEPWFSNFNKRIVKTPKLYFRDTGLLCFLLGLDKNSLGSSHFLGALWETCVFAELRKMNNSSARPVNFWYYRDQRAREIDFIAESGGTLLIIDCKWKETPSKADCETMAAVSNELENSGSNWLPGQHYLVTNTPAAFSLTERISTVRFTDLPRVLEEMP